MSKPTKLDEIFTDTVARQYVNDCKRNGVEPTYNGLLDYAINCNLISSAVVRSFVVIHEYPRFAYAKNGGKRQAVWMLEDELGVPERTIYGILTKGQKRFKCHQPKANRASRKKK